MSSIELLSNLSTTLFGRDYYTLDSNDRNVLFRYLELNIDVLGRDVVIAAMTMMRNYGPRFHIGSS